MQSFFIWKNTDCRSMGITLQAPVPIVRPEERVKHIEIPGISGDMTETESEEDDPIYNSYIQTATISVRGGFRVREVYNWLRGSGYVTFSGEPDRRQPARIIGAVTLEKVSRNMDRWRGECQFYCQPLKEKLHSEQKEVAINETIRNSGDVPEKPEISVSATGSTLVITAGGKTLTVSGISSGTGLIIDSQLKMVLSADRQTDLTEKSSGQFPVLKPGANTVTGSGWSSATFNRRERFL